MKYTVEIKQNGQTVSYTPDCTMRQAEKIARNEAANNPDCQVYVTWFRPEDSQRGYLNADGHAITGEAWKPINPAASALGSIRTERKAASSRENGKKGGRPRKS